jgi:hypothetical protein
MNERREQKPDSRFDTNGGVCVKGDTIGLDNPAFNYRVIHKDKQMEDFNRINRHKAKGYVVVADDQSRTVMACPKGLREAREKDSQARSERFLTQTSGSAVTGQGFTTANDKTEVIANSAIDD